VQIHAVSGGTFVDAEVRPRDEPGRLDPRQSAGLDRESGPLTVDHAVSRRRAFAMRVVLSRSDCTLLPEASRAGGHIAVIGEGVELVRWALIEAEAAEVIDAGRIGPGEGHETQRSSDRDRL
jgi:hypothetical protein